MSSPGCCVETPLARVLPDGAGRRAVSQLRCTHAVVLPQLGRRPAQAHVARLQHVRVVGRPEGCESGFWLSDNGTVTAGRCPLQRVRPDDQLGANVEDRIQSKRGHDQGAILLALALQEPLATGTTRRSPPRNSSVMPEGAISPTRSDAKACGPSCKASASAAAAAKPGVHRPRRRFAISAPDGGPNSAAPRSAWGGTCTSSSRPKRK